jgi:2-polyprenyl-3-methyl-5-hydroxy-6-metoxy-1,4-benzoquinol methylase
MTDWQRKLFTERADLFLKLMNPSWVKSQQLVDGIVGILKGFGIRSGNLLDLCCGNGRTAIYMAKKGFNIVGVDVSRAFIQDARRRARKF